MIVYTVDEVDIRYHASHGEDIRLNVFFSANTMHKNNLMSDLSNIIWIQS